MTRQIGPIYWMITYTLNIVVQLVKHFYRRSVGNALFSLRLYFVFALSRKARQLEYFYRRIIENYFDNISYRNIIINLITEALF